MSTLFASGSFTALSLVAAILHMRQWRKNTTDVELMVCSEPIDLVAVEAGKMLSGQEAYRILKMLCLAVAGVASFLSPPWHNIVAFAIFAVPILSIADSIFTERSVARQLRLAQNRARQV